MKYAQYMAEAERYIAALDHVFELTVLLHDDMTESLAREGLTTSRAHLLWELHQLGPTTQTSLAEALGVSARNDADGENAEVGTGAQVVEVQPDSAAATAGIKVGDVVTAVGDRPVTTSTELTAAVRSEAPGDKITLTVRSGNDTRTVEVTLGSTS